MQDTNLQLESISGRGTNNGECPVLHGCSSSTRHQKRASNRGTKGSSTRYTIDAELQSSQRYNVHVCVDATKETPPDQTSYPVGDTLRNWKPLQIIAGSMPGQI